eukprot:1536402-Rhodomonas_salina.1
MKTNVNAALRDRRPNRLPVLYCVLLQPSCLTSAGDPSSSPTDIALPRRHPRGGFQKFDVGVVKTASVT